jgi:hypothetical protein
VPATGVPRAILAVAWRTGDLRTEVRNFVDLLPVPQTAQQSA